MASEGGEQDQGCSGGKGLKPTSACHSPDPNYPLSSVLLKKEACVGPNHALGVASRLALAAKDTAL